MLQTNFFGTLQSEEDIRQLLADHEATPTDDTPAVYCGTYGKYNSGSIEGQWVDITSFDTFDEFIEYCRILHRDEDDPELMFQDYENFPEEWYSESCMDSDTFDKIQEYAAVPDKEVADAYISIYGADAFSEEQIQYCYLGQWDSEADFAEYIFNELYGITEFPSLLRGFIDYDKFAEYILSSGGYEYYDGYVFQDY